MKSCAIAALVLMLFGIGGASAGTWVYTSTAYTTECGYDVPGGCGGCSYTNVTGLLVGNYDVTVSQSASFDNGGCYYCNLSSPHGSIAHTHVAADSSIRAYTRIRSNTGGGSSMYYGDDLLLDGVITVRIFIETGRPHVCCPATTHGAVIISNESAFVASGVTDCVDLTELYVYNSGSYHYIDSTTESSYSFRIYGGVSYRLLFGDVYYDFVCDGNEGFDYNACTFIYGYTCGVDSTRLYKYDDGGWVIDEAVSHGVGYNVYEFPITNGEDYRISFAERGFVCYNETFSCTGSNMCIDFDRCQWVYPPSAGPEAIYLWAGYDYNIVIMKDTHGNLIENSQVAIYDETDDTHIHKWVDTPDGYLLLGTKFDTDHDVQITARTFDGIFTLNTIFPANGTPIIGEEDIAITNWTIPIMYNLGLQPVDQTGKPVFDVFCGLMEYTPLNPLSFWGMDLSDRGYVPVTNCSGFAMCDIIAEKDGYADYNVSMLNWTSRSAMIKDYRHNIVMEEE